MRGCRACPEGAFSVSAERVVNSHIYQIISVLRRAFLHSGLVEKTTQITNIARIDCTNAARTARPITMSSREIAELVGKRHTHVLRDIEAMLAQINRPNFGPVDFLNEYKDAKGERRKEYLLPRDLTVTLITGYRADLRYRVVKRLEELEASTRPASMDPVKLLDDPAYLRGLVLEAAERQIALKAQVESMRETVEVHEALTGAKEVLFNTRTAAKQLRIHEKELQAWMLANEWVYTQGGNRLAYQRRLDAGYLRQVVRRFQKANGKWATATKPMITLKGLDKLARDLRKAEAAASPADF